MVITQTDLDYVTTTTIHSKNLKILTVFCFWETHLFFQLPNLTRSIPKILEKLLEGGKSNIEVFNAGVFGYGTINEYLYLKNYGLKFSPDLVLLGIYAPNDCGDNVGFPDKMAIGGKQVSLSSIKNKSKEIVSLEHKGNGMLVFYSYI